MDVEKHSDISFFKLYIFSFILEIIFNYCSFKTILYAYKRKYFFLSVETPSTTSFHGRIGTNSGLNRHTSFSPTNKQTTDVHKRKENSKAKYSQIDEEGKESIVFVFRKKIKRISFSF